MTKKPEYKDDETITFLKELKNYLEENKDEKIDIKFLISDYKKEMDRFNKLINYASGFNITFLLSSMNDITDNEELKFPHYLLIGCGKTNSSYNAQRIAIKNENVKNEFLKFLSFIVANNKFQSTFEQSVTTLRAIEIFNLRLYDKRLKEFFNRKFFNRIFWIKLFLSYNNENIPKEDEEKELTFVFKKIFNKDDNTNIKIKDNKLSKELVDIEKKNNIEPYSIFLYTQKHYISYDKSDDYEKELLSDLVNNNYISEKNFNYFSYFILEKSSLKKEEKEKLLSCRGYKEFKNKVIFDKIKPLCRHFKSKTIISSLMIKKDLLNEENLALIEKSFENFLYINNDGICRCYISFLSLFKRNSVSYRSVSLLLLLTPQLFMSLTKLNFLDIEEKENFLKVAFDFIKETKEFKKTFLLKIIDDSKAKDDNQYKNSCIENLKNYIIHHIDEFDSSKKKIINKGLLEKSL